jgi:hypothetical protein
MHLTSAYILHITSFICSLFFPSSEPLFTQSFTLVDDHFRLSIILLILSILLDLLYSTLLSAGLHRQHCYSHTHTTFSLLSSLFAFRPVLLFHDCATFSHFILRFSCLYFLSTYSSRLLNGRFMTITMNIFLIEF